MNLFLKIRDWKGGLDYIFGKIATEEEMAYYKEKRDTLMGGIGIEPLEEEFSSEEMRSTLSYIIGYIEGLAETIHLWYHGEEFEKIIEEANGKYGYSKEKGFYEELLSEE